MDQARGSYRLTARPGASANQQAGFARLDLQQFALGGVSKNCFDHVLAFGKRRHLVELRVGRLLGENLLQVVRRDCGVDETVFNLHRNVVFVVHDQ